jgi:adenosylcobinamide kinase / adenosylcobinamide-phosphate guanylyltransferase
LGFVFAWDWWLVLAEAEHIMTVILITGGARSGKSLRAEGRARAFPGKPIYIATAEARDAEMSERIAAHRARRGADWIEREAPLDLVEAIDQTDGGGARLVDCLTLWLSNLLHAERDWRHEASRVADALARQRNPVILVTNEVGLGIVPDNALARAFRDAAGSLNQRIAAVASEVELMVAGLPLKVK